jgi:hypothetical protein
MTYLHLARAREITASRTATVRQACVAIHALRHSRETLYTKQHIYYLANCITKPLRVKNKRKAMWLALVATEALMQSIYKQMLNISSMRNFCKVYNNIPVSCMPEQNLKKNSWGFFHANYSNEQRFFWYYFNAYYCLQFFSWLIYFKSPSCLYACRGLYAVRHRYGGLNTNI